MMTNITCKCIEMNLLPLGEYYGHFLFTPLEGGEGATLANMVRRSLLSSLFESKITGVRFAGVKDEFSNMPGVREDLLEIILNLKEIVIKNPSYDPCYGRIKVYGPAIVTASSLVLPKDVVVINPRSHVLTICDKCLVELEVKIEPGKIYSQPETSKTEGTGNFLRVDSNFTPILKINSYIKSITEDPEPLSQNVKNKNEELHIEIYTNGALLPHQALMLAGNRLASLVLALQKIWFPTNMKTNPGVKKGAKTTKLIEKSMLKKNDETSKKLNVKSDKLSNKSKLEDKFNEAFEEMTGMQSISKQQDIADLVAEIIAAEAKEDKLKKKKKRGSINPTKEVRKQQKVLMLQDKTLEDLGLSKRVVKILTNSNIKNRSDLLKIDSKDLSKIKGLGTVSIKEINEKLALSNELPIDE